MRKIEFRGKWESNGKWIYGSLVDKKSGERLISRHNKMLEFEGRYVHPETVGQYTGLNDKNDEKIFEGDIVSFGDGNFEIVFGDACFFISDPHIHYSMELHTTIGMGPDDILGQCGVEVIGNIHDNPELLEADKNPFKDTEDERKCRCNCCMAEFMEGEIVLKDDVEHCPDCGETGYIQDGLEKDE